MKVGDEITTIGTTAETSPLGIAWTTTLWHLKITWISADVFGADEIMTGTPWNFFLAGENIAWIYGHHEQNSPEVKALWVARSLA